MTREELIDSMSEDCCYIGDFLYDKTLCLDGWFTIDDLRMIIKYMEDYKDD